MLWPRPGHASKALELLYHGFSNLLYLLLRTDKLHKLIVKATDYNKRELGAHVQVPYEA